MVKILHTGAFWCCASAGDVDSSSLLQSKRIVASGTLRSCQDDPDCTPLETQCCADWLKDNECSAHQIHKLHTTECLGTCSESDCCEPKPYCGDDGQPTCPHLYRNKDNFDHIQCDGRECETEECCIKESCDAWLDGGQCPQYHLTKGNLATLLCAGCTSNSDAETACCKETCKSVLPGGTCPATHVKTKGLMTACVNCDEDAALDKCCRPATCEDRLDLGVCPDKYSTKGKLSELLCPNCNTQEAALDQCCEPFPQCPACAAHEVQKHEDGYQCQSATCGDDECCIATCQSIIGQCPSTHVETKSLQTQCPNCDSDEAEELCCAPATCGDALNKPCDEIPNHDWKDDMSSDSLCIVDDERPCNKAESFHACCKTMESEANVEPPTMRYCTVHGDPHIRTFDNKDLTTTYLPRPLHPAFQTGKKWLVKNDRVKIQGHFIGANGASTLGGLAIKVDDVFVQVHNPPSIKVNGQSSGYSDYVTLLEDDDADLDTLNYTAYQTWGHQAIQDSGNSNWKQLYIRFPLFKDEDAERSYVEVYVRGHAGHLDAAIFMMGKADFAARGMSDTITGLCGDNNGNSGNEWPNMLLPTYTQVSNADNIFQHISDSENAMPWPLVPQCTSSERHTFQGLCEACLGQDVPNRDDAVLDCTNDRCAGEPSPEVYMDCDFLNSLR